MPDLWMDVDTALSEVPVNIMPLLDDTDFKSREVSIAYNAAGMDLVWNFVTTGGAFTQTAVTPTTAGDYDWTHQGDGIYTIEIPASGGASINNDTEGFGWFTGFVTGVLPWRGPTIGFRAAGLNNVLIDGGDTLDVNVTAMAAGVVTAAAIATDAVDADALAADAIAEINATVDTALSDYDGPTHAELISEIDDVQTDIAALNDPTAAAIADQVWEEAIADHSGTGGSTAEALNAAGGAGDPWVTALPGAYGAGSAGNIIGNLNDLSAAEVNAEVDTAISDAALATAAALATVDTVVDAIKAVTDNLPDSGALTSLATAAALATVAGYLDTEIAAILADTGELQTDWANGGRLDLLIDAIKAKTDNLPTDPADASDVAAAIAALNDLSAAQINAEVDTAISDAALATAANLATVDTVVDAIKVVTDALTSAAAAKLALSAGTMVTGTAEAGTLSTTQMTTDLAEATDDHFNGRIIIWTSGALANQATDITDYAGSNGLVTFTAVTEAPQAGNTFVIV